MAAVVAGAAQPPAAAAEKPGAAGATPKSPNADSKPEVRLRRLESFTWNPVTQEFTWVLSTGDLNSNGYSATKQETYVIHMDAATMRVGSEDRHFDPQEAAQVGKVMDLICRYALESTIWWENGGGKTDHPAKPQPGATPTPTPTDQNHRSRQIPPGMLRGDIQQQPVPQAVAAAVNSGRQ
jgi:hypothetical protein